MTLKGRVALVTGVSRRSGIGFAIADRLAAQGADIFIQSFAPYDARQPYGADPAGVPALGEALRRHGGRVEHLEADFLDPTAPQRVITAATESLGHLDIVVANHAHRARWAPSKN
jgi:3-oxoacyl-[acyl-carrier protein] reductase